MAFAEINGFTMHYEDTGQGDPIILQPGWISTGDAWAGIVPGLAGSYRCIVLETRGTGQSERVAGGHTIVQFADDLIALADHLSIDRFTIVGHSMGGVIATEVAAKVPQRVERLVYVASTADASYVPNEIWNMLLGLSDAIADGDKEAAKGFMMGITARREGVPFDLIAEAAVACSPEFIRDSIRSCAKFSPSRPPSAIETPALVIGGSADAFLGASLATHAALPNATLHVFNRASHLLNVDVPVETAAAIDDFMQNGIVSAEMLMAG